MLSLMKTNPKTMTEEIDKSHSSQHYNDVTICFCNGNRIKNSKPFRIKLDGSYVYEDDKKDQANTNGQWIRIKHATHSDAFEAKNSGKIVDISFCAKRFLNNTFTMATILINYLHFNKYVQRRVNEISMCTFDAALAPTHLQRVGVDNGTTIRLDECPLYYDVLCSTHAWQKMEKCLSDEPLETISYQKIKNVLPDYNHLINFILEDAPPDYESITGIHVNVEEIAELTKRCLGGRNRLFENTRTFTGIKQFGKTRIGAYILVSVSLLATALVVLFKVVI